MISELETSLSSPNKAISTDKSTKDNSKVNGQLRSRIKVLEYRQEILWLQTHRNCASVSLSFFVAWPDILVARGDIPFGQHQQLQLL